MLKVLTVLDPVLHQKARPVRGDEFGDSLVSYLQELVTTMYAAKGAGLAAPQVGDSRRIVVMDAGNGQVLHMVNPVVLRKSDTTSSIEEGCLSVPGQDLRVSRPSSVEVSWEDGQGNTNLQTFSGFAAAVVQHEIDHLDGVTLVSRMRNFKRKSYLKKLRQETGP